VTNGASVAGEERDQVLAAIRRQADLLARPSRGDHPGAGGEDGGERQGRGGGIDLARDGDALGVRLDEPGRQTLERFGEQVEQDDARS
jgi:hypothetical protein